MWFSVSGNKLYYIIGGAIGGVIIFIICVVCCFVGSVTYVFSSIQETNDSHYYRPQTKLREGNVFIPVCDSVHRGDLCPRGISVCGSLSGESMSSMVSVKGDLCPWGSLSRGCLFQSVCPGSLYPSGVSVQRGLCLGDSLQGGLSPGGSLSRGSSVRRGYAFQWNAFLYLSRFCFD